MEKFPYKQTNLANTILARKLSLSGESLKTSIRDWNEIHEGWWERRQKSRIFRIGRWGRLWQKTNYTWFNNHVCSQVHPSKNSLFEEREFWRKCSVLTESSMGRMKSFSLEMVVNYQNDRVYATSPGNIHEGVRIHLEQQKPTSVMFWAVVTSDGLKLPFVFIEERLKVNNGVYCQISVRDLLTVSVSHIGKTLCLYPKLCSCTHS